MAKSSIPEPDFSKLILDNHIPIGFVEVFLKGYAQGVAKGRIETAQKLLIHGFSWECITDITGLKIEDLEKTKVDNSPNNDNLAEIVCEYGDYIENGEFLRALKEKCYPDVRLDS